MVGVGEGEWRLKGDRIEKAAAMTNWDYYEAQARFQRVMQALGVSEQLKVSAAVTSQPGLRGQRTTSASRP